MFRLSSGTPTRAKSALLKGNKSAVDNFLGLFETIWLEENTTAIIRIELEITTHQDNQEVYNLRWSDRKENGQSNFEGIGMLEKDLLVGCYWKVH